MSLYQFHSSDTKIFSIGDLNSLTVTWYTYHYTHTPHTSVMSPKWVIWHSWLFWLLIPTSPVRVGAEEAGGILGEGGQGRHRVWAHTHPEPQRWGWPLKAWIWLSSSQALECPVPWVHFGVPLACFVPGWTLLLPHCCCYRLPQPSSLYQFSWSVFWEGLWWVVSSQRETWTRTELHCPSLARGHQ